MIDEVMDLFIELGADIEDLDFPIVYGVARDGKAGLSLDEEMSDVSPLLDVILKFLKSCEYILIVLGSSESSLFHLFVDSN